MVSLSGHLEGRWTHWGIVSVPCQLISQLDTDLQVLLSPAFHWDSEDDTRSHSQPTVYIMDLSERIAAGIDTVDADGNTVFHFAATSQLCMERLENILHLGASVVQTNNAGRLPLHALCGHGWFDDRRVVGMLEWFIEHTQNIDAEDLEGIRPLHLAAMMSEYFTKGLLAAGADSSGRTAQGLTPLHLACRARQSNIVGLLIEHLRQRYDGDETAARINCLDSVGRSPLHYACKSGRLETVSLLLAAGADPWIEDHSGRTPMDACCEFEEEQDLWSDYWRPMDLEYAEFGRRNIPADWDHDACGGLTIDDKLRPWVRAGRISRPYRAERAEPGTLYSGMHTDQASTRLEEILDMLYEAHRKSEGDLERTKRIVRRCLDQCDNRSLSYTHRCFQQLKKKLDPSTSGSQHGDKEQQQEADMIRSIAKQYGSKEPEKNYPKMQDEIDFRTTQHLLAMREYSAVELLLCRGRCSTRAMSSIVRLLADHGFARLIEKILGSDHPPPAHIYTDTFIDEPENEDPDTCDPVLLIACQRSLPNMEVVRLLVQQAHVDLDARSRTAEQRDAMIEFIDGEASLKSI